MTDSLEKIFSERGEAVPAEQTTEQAPAPEKVEQTTQPETEGQQQEADGGQQKTVPHEALHAEKQKVKRYTEEVFDLRRENTAVRQELQRIAQLLEKPKEEPKDWFADPDAAFQQNIQRNLHPLLQQQAQQVQQTREFVSRRFAEQVHGKEAVTAAYQAMEQRLQTDPSTQVVYQQIMSSGDPWDALATWHKRETFLAEAGNDPEAYKAKIKAEAIAEFQQGNDGQAAPQQQPRVMPSNIAGQRNVGSRTGPTWAGPESIDSIFNTKRKAAS